MQLEIQARQNFGTVNKPKIGVLLVRDEDGALFQPPDGSLVRDQVGRLFRVRCAPEYGVWVRLKPLDGDSTGPAKDRLELVPPN